MLQNILPCGLPPRLNQQDRTDQRPPTNTDRQTWCTNSQTLMCVCDLEHLPYILANKGPSVVLRFVKNPYSHQEQYFWLILTLRNVYQSKCMCFLTLSPLGAFPGESPGSPFFPWEKEWQRNKWLRAIIHRIVWRKCQWCLSTQKSLGHCYAVVKAISSPTGPRRFEK